MLEDVERFDSYQVVGRRRQRRRVFHGYERFEGAFGMIFESVQCKHTFRNGRSCRFQAEDDSLYCDIHRASGRLLNALTPRPTDIQIKAANRRAKEGASRPGYGIPPEQTYTQFLIERSTRECGLVNVIQAGSTAYWDYGQKIVGIR